MKAKHMTILQFGRFQAEVIAMTALPGKDTRLRKATDLRRQITDALTSNPRHGPMRALSKQVDAMIAQDVTLVHLAAREGDARLLQELASLLSCGVHVQWNLQDATGSTALHHALRSGPDGPIPSRAQCVAVLVGQGASISIQTDQKRTALHYAAERGDLESLQLMLGHRQGSAADWDLFDATGRTAVLLALEAKHHSCAEYLVNQGARTAQAASLAKVCE